MKDLPLPRILAGVGVIAVGVLALLGAFNLINFSELFSTYWPLLVIGAGIILLISDLRQNYVWAILFILLGVIWQLGRLDMVDVNIWHLFWPLVIIAFGWSILVQRSGVCTDKKTENSTAILGGNTIKNNSADYKGSNLTAILGGTTLDLRKATIKKEATIEIFALMGGMEILVPENWVVRSSVMPILGGVENNTHPPKGSKAPVLNIVGTAIMGGVEVKH